MERTGKIKEVANIRETETKKKTKHQRTSVGGKRGWEKAVHEKTSGGKRTKNRKRFIEADLDETKTHAGGQKNDGAKTKMNVVLSWTLKGVATSQTDATQHLERGGGR